MTRAVVIEIRTGEAISIDGGRVLLVLEEKSGQRARIRFETQDATPIDRVRNRTNIRAVVGLGERELKGTT